VQQIGFNGALHRTIAPHRRTIAPYHRTIAPYHRTTHAP